MCATMRNGQGEPDTKAQHVVIVGASIAGLMTGIGLARKGCKVTVLEKEAENRGSGGGLQIDGGRFSRNETARFLRNLISNGKKSTQLWGAIESRLRAEAQSYENIDLQYAKRVHTIDQDAKMAWVVTDQGETFSGDILLGADGHRSIVRRHVAPDKPDATFAGYMVWISGVNASELPKAHRPQYREPGYTMLDSQNGFLFGNVIDQEDGSDNHRIGCAWYDNSRNELLRRLGCVNGDVVKHSLKGADIPEEVLADLMAQASKRWPEPWLSVTRHAIQTRQLTGIPIKEYVPDRLIRDRIALVGDAAHVPAPITASGVNESIQDAAELSTCVAKGMQRSTVTQILQDYEATRLEKARQMVLSGHYFSQSFGRV